MGGGIKLIQNSDSTTRTYTNYKQGKSWSKVLVTPTAQETNTSSLTGDTHAKIKQLFKETNDFKKTIEEHKTTTNEQITMLTETVTTLKDEFKSSIEQQFRMTQSITQAIAALKTQITEMRENQINLQQMLETNSRTRTDMEVCTDPNGPITQDVERYEQTPPDSEEMDFNRTDAKRTRDEVILSVHELSGENSSPAQCVGQNHKQKIIQLNQSGTCEQDECHGRQ